MSLTVVCITCKYKLRVPSRLAGRRVTCPKCGQAVQAPEAPPPEPEDAAKPPPVDPNVPAPEVPLSLADRCGRAGLMLGVFAFLVLFLGLCLGDYANIACALVSGFGLSLSLFGLIGSALSVVGARLRGKPRGTNTRKDLPVSYPIAGSAVCTLVLGLALWPRWVESMKHPGPRSFLQSSGAVENTGFAIADGETQRILPRQRPDLLSSEGDWQGGPRLTAAAWQRSDEKGFVASQQIVWRVRPWLSGVPRQPGSGFQRAAISIYATIAARQIGHVRGRPFYRGGQASPHAQNER
jgi:hypothetical protein